MVSVRPVGPYNLALSLSVAAAFSPEPPPADSVLRIPGKIDGTSIVAEIRQTQLSPPVLEISSTRRVEPGSLEKMAVRVTLADLDLRPFYSICEGHPKLGPMTRLLHGLKFLRPVSIFDMAVIAITEQQISLAAARQIRDRLVKRFGEEIEGLWIFPDADRLSSVEPADLAACGLSLRKAEYISGLARGVHDGRIDLDSIEGMSDEEVRAFITNIRGFGKWSADYILIRGLGRTDAVPTDDLAVRTVVGHVLGNGNRMTSAEVEEALAPFTPFRGLATSYLLAHARITMSRFHAGTGRQGSDPGPSGPDSTKRRTGR